VGTVHWLERAAPRKAAHNLKRKGKPAVKIPTDHIDLTALGYEGYWVEMPRSVKEGFLHELARNRKPSKNGETPSDDADSTEARDANIKILSLITAWNIDDDDGKIYPVLSKAKNRTEQEKIVSELPVDIIVHLAQRISGSVQVPEKVKDF
jgi:hypothetical protein